MNLSKLYNKNSKKSIKDNKGDSPNKKSSLLSIINSKVILDSIMKLDPRYLAKNNPVMFTVEIGFFIVFFISLFPGISKTFV